MKEPITYVGIDAHARELHLAMLRWEPRNRRCGRHRMNREPSSVCGADSNETRQAHRMLL